MLREVINTELAVRLGVQAQPNTKFDNFLHETVQMGYKTTVAAGCMVRAFSFCISCMTKQSSLTLCCSLQPVFLPVNASSIQHPLRYLTRTNSTSSCSLQERMQSAVP